MSKVHIGYVSTFLPKLKKLSGNKKLSKQKVAQAFMALDLDHQHDSRGKRCIWQVTDEQLELVVEHMKHGYDHYARQSNSAREKQIYEPSEEEIRRGCAAAIAKHPRRNAYDDPYPVETPVVDTAGYADRFAGGWARAE